MDYRVPFCRPYLTGNELAYMGQCLESRHLAGDGPFTRRCESLLESLVSTERVLLTTSGTGALEMAAILCDLKPGDEVVMPSYTFASTANAFLLRGAKPIFVDIDENTFNIDATLIEDAVTDRTRAIVPVHYAGIACDMDRIGRIAREHDLIVVEDAAQALDATYQGAYLGTIGDMGAFSFHETKNFVCGEGGALVCNHASLAERAEIVREKGTNRSQFFRGEVDKYSWMDTGSSYVPSEILSAFLLAQLEQLEKITELRHRVFSLYQELLAPLASRGLIGLGIVPQDCRQNFHMFYLTVSDADTRTALLAHLNAKGFLAVFHYVPLHTSPMGRRLGYEPGMLPVTETMSSRIVRLPFFPGLEESAIRSIVDEIESFFTVGRLASTG